MKIRSNINSKLTLVAALLLSTLAFTSCGGGSSSSSTTATSTTSSSVSIPDSIGAKTLVLNITSTTEDYFSGVMTIVFDGTNATASSTFKDGISGTVGYFKASTESGVITWNSSRDGNIATITINSNATFTMTWSNQSGQEGTFTLTDS